MGGPGAAPVRVGRAATGGAASRLGDGRVVFVRHALPGELVEVALTEDGARFARADATRVLEASAERVAAPCPHAGPGRCGGCDLQHASAAAQDDWRVAVAREHLARLAGADAELSVERPPHGARGSRVRLRAAVASDGRLALRRWRSHDLEVLDDCYVADERLAPAFAARWPAGAEVELRAIGDGDPFAVVSVGAGATTTDLAGRALEGAVSEVDVAGRRYRVSPGSFWQAHRDAPELLVAAVLEGAGLVPGDTAVDLYGGAGLFGAALADAAGPAGRVTLVESSIEAAADALANAPAAGRLSVRAARVTPRVAALVAERDVVVVDPPRTGLARGVAAALCAARPRRVVYVSCDAATLARDLGVLLTCGYRLVGLRAFDLFPMTEHLELVALLDRGRPRDEASGEGPVLGPRGG